MNFGESNRALTHTHLLVLLTWPGAHTNTHSNAFNIKPFSLLSFHAFKPSRQTIHLYRQFHFSLQSFLMANIYHFLFDSDQSTEVHFVFLHTYSEETKKCFITTFDPFVPFIFLSRRKVKKKSIIHFSSHFNKLFYRISIPSHCHTNKINEEIWFEAKRVKN